MALRRLLLSLVLLGSGVVAGPTPASAATHDKTWSSDEILAPPLFEPGSYSCSRTHPVLAIPNFRRGLVADYVFEISAGGQDSASYKIDEFNNFAGRAGKDILVARLTSPKTLPKGGGLIAVRDNVVLSDMDDLLARYFSICQLGREPELMLRSITYHSASVRERAEAPARESWYDLGGLPTPPLSLQISPGETDLLPPPVAGGDYHFATSFDPLPEGSGLIPLRQGYRWRLDPSKVVIGAGVRLAALFFGHNDLRSLKPLSEDGFDVLTIEEGGRIETLVIDRHVSVSADELVKRTAEVTRYQSFETGLRLTRLVLYPAALGGIDALRTTWGRELKSQLAARSGLELADEYTQRMTYLPQIDDTERLLKAEWSNFTGGASGTGYDAIFGPPGSLFGKLESISCEPDDTVFYCKAGVTFTTSGRPEYAERALYFERFRHESGWLELKAADPRAPTYDPLGVPVPVVAPIVATGVDAVPTVAEVQQLLAAGWRKISASMYVMYVDGVGKGSFASEFAGSGDLNTAFSEVHDLTCTERSAVFTCAIGVVYTSNGVPRYRQSGYHLFQRVRDAEGAWQLKVYIETDIIVTDAKHAL